jgi:hypothetical protein
VPLIDPAFGFVKTDSFGLINTNAFGLPDGTGLPVSVLVTKCPAPASDSVCGLLFSLKVSDPNNVGEKHITELRKNTAANVFWHEKRGFTLS